MTRSSAIAHEENLAEHRHAKVNSFYYILYIPFILHFFITCMTQRFGTLRKHVDEHTFSEY